MGRKKKIEPLRFQKDDTRFCKRCGTRKPLSAFGKAPQSKHRIKRCWHCLSCAYKARKVRNPNADIIRLLNQSKIGAMLRGLEFKLTVKDLLPFPSHCPYLGVLLEYKPTYERRHKPDNLASIDRIDSTKGYLPGNVQIISFLANRMKTNATVEQLLAFAKGILKTHGD